MVNNKPSGMYGGVQGPEALSSRRTLGGDSKTPAQQQQPMGAASLSSAAEEEAVRRASVRQQGVFSFCMTNKKKGLALHF